MILEKWGKWISCGRNMGVPVHCTNDLELERQKVVKYGSICGVIGSFALGFGPVQNKYQLEQMSNSFVLKSLT
jgi:hypothetical protein